jgi:HTH-type transcriptional regulator/antitoxin HigA
MDETETFLPNWASPPGETISDILDERNLSITDFARQIGATLDFSKELLQGKATVTRDLAMKLEHALGGSADFWVNRESHYRNDVARLQSDAMSALSEEWLKELPLRDMTAFGWIKPSAPITEKVAECLRFFGVPNVEAWRETYRGILESAAFRTSPTFDSQSVAVAAWLRQGEIESASINCRPWDVMRFRTSLSEIRALTRKRNPSVFIPELQRMCAECGVAVVIVRAPAGCRASGATLFLSPTKALILLSFRYLSDDHFWFTFFHEAGHLVLHGKDDLFLEGMESCSTQEEQQANDFAASTLIPEHFQSEMESLPLDGREVIRFARKAGVAPGIVVGQLQHLGLITRMQLNNLKTRFNWPD